VYVESDAHSDGAAATSLTAFIPLTTREGEPANATELVRALCAAAHMLEVSPSDLCRAIEQMTSFEACNLELLSSVVGGAT
jgi:hypothetical protein